MIADRIASVIGILASMVLVGSVLVARRSRLNGRGGVMVLAWVGIILLLIVAGRWLDGTRPAS